MYVSSGRYVPIIQEVERHQPRRIIPTNPATEGFLQVTL